MSPPVDSMRSQLGAAMAGVAPGLAAADRLCVACVDLLGVDGAAISMVHDGRSRGTFGASSPSSRRLDEYQFTFGEGPCLDATATRTTVLVPDLDSPAEQRWPGYTGAVLGDGIRAVFAMPIMITSSCVGALDLFREDAGPLSAEHLAGGMVAAELAGLPLLDLLSLSKTANEAVDGHGTPLSPQETDQPFAGMDRLEVYQATGMLIAQLDVDAAEAVVRLRAHAIATGRTASEVAWAIVGRRLVLERDDTSEPHGRTRR